MDTYYDYSRYIACVPTHLLIFIVELNGETPIMNNSMTDDTSAHQKPSAAKFVAAAAPVQGNHLPAHATPTHTAQANPPVHANHSIKTNVPAKPNLPVPAHALSAAEEAKFQAVPHTAAGPNPHKAIVVVEGIPQVPPIMIIMYSYIFNKGQSDQDFLQTA